jgi:hypothetical protein
VGSGQMNIFILTEDPLTTFEKVKDVLIKKRQLMDYASVAYRKLDEENYFCLWPKDMTNFRVL